MTLRADATRLRRRSRSLLHTGFALIAAFALALSRGVAPDFVYDAAQYWAGAVAIVSGASPVEPGALATRGVFTSGVYILPAFAAKVGGSSFAGWAVLSWNAALIAVLCAVLVPRIATLLASDDLTWPPASRVWISALLGSFVLAGFAPFPLVDVWSAALALAGVYGVIAGRRWWVLLLAGVSLSIAVNLRPATIAPVMLAVLVLATVRLVPVVIMGAGALVAAVPQVVLNVHVWGLWSPVPRETVALSAVQAANAPFALRYDTIAFADRPPQQWFCDPGYAQLLVDDPTPINQLGVLASAFRHLPESLWFLTQKASANLQWSDATPYENTPGAGIAPIGVVVVLVSAIGLVALISYTVRNRHHRTRLTMGLGMLAFWAGALGTLVFSTPETRFAMPLVMVGMIGLVSLVPARWPPVRLSRDGAVATVSALLLIAILLIAGGIALMHSLPPGALVSAAGCAGLAR